MAIARHFYMGVPISPYPISDDQETQRMQNRDIWKAALFFAGIACILPGAIATFVTAEEKKEIPDHSTFQTCHTCHAEKQNMWAASNHSKAIGLIAANNQAATDCSGCHSPKKPEAGVQQAIAVSAPKESFHKAPCLACHGRQKTEFDHRVVLQPEKLCDTCHTQRSIFLGLGAKGIEDSRNFHSGVPCISCHMTEGNHAMKVLRPDDPGLTEKRLDTCTACHKDNNREARVEQIQEWQSNYDESMAPLLADVKAIEEALKKKPDLLDASLKSRLEGVKTNLALLENDGSRGFHNFVFLLEITSLASGDLKEIKAAIK